MSCFLEDCESIQFSQGMQTDNILATIMNRYIASNPICPPTFRVSSAKGIKRNGEYRYVFDFDRIYPGTEREQFVYAWAKLWSGEDCSRNFRAVPYSPMKVYVNNEVTYQSNYYEEKTRSSQSPVQARLHRGWNSILLSFLKTPLGFGGEFGSAFFKYTPVHFLAPTAEREGREGFLYTFPMEEMEQLPALPMEEKQSPVQWFPQLGWSREDAGKGQFARIFGAQPGRRAYGWVKALFTEPEGGHCLLSGKTAGPLAVYLDGKKIFKTKKSGEFRQEFSAKSGLCDIIAEGECDGVDWGFSLAITQSGRKTDLLSPCNAKGAPDPWIYAGPFADWQDPCALSTTTRLWDTVNGKDYWHVDLPDRYVRPFLETESFGQWNYPVGVTLYGLMHAAKMMGRHDVLNYVNRHIRLCTDYYDYALWDQENFGAASLNFQIASIESLDDCGSFSSTMLEQTLQDELPGSRKIADLVVDFIENHQDRLPNGALYRFHSSLVEMKNTVWLDDLYMSVPFLTRYYRLTGEHKYLDDAAKQFLLYRDMMLIPGLNVMSHVYYTDRKIASGVPWGRGNGWALFSLSELLLAMPEDFHLRGELLDLFRTLCEGCRALQDQEGLWHQVLNDSESYPESSCSAMFISAFARGVRGGWFGADGQKYYDAALRGWLGLTRNSIDSNGNIYGICKGSGHSFTPRYYKYELNWIRNDTHGIGIVLLAGVETKQMVESRGKEK
jgi:rhamnogalacturonyl hydrolase YesR